MWGVPSPKSGYGRAWLAWAYLSHFSTLTAAGIWILIKIPVEWLGIISGGFSAIETNYNQPILSIVFLFLIFGNYLIYTVIKDSKICCYGVLACCDDPEQNSTSQTSSNSIGPYPTASTTFLLTTSLLFHLPLRFAQKSAMIYAVLISIIISHLTCHHTTTPWAWRKLNNPV